MLLVQNAFLLFSPCLTATHGLLRTKAAQQLPVVPLLQPPAPARPAPLCHRAQSTSWIHNLLPSFRCCRFRLQTATRNGQVSLHQSQKMDFASVTWLQKLLLAAVSHSERSPGSRRCCDLQTCNCCSSPAGDLSGYQALCCQAMWIETTRTLLW